MAKADWPPKSKMFTSQLMAEKSAEACMELDTKLLLSHTRQPSSDNE